MKLLNTFLLNLKKNITHVSSEFSTTPLITMKANQQVYIENKYTIQSFTSDKITLLYKEGMIQITGEKLMITTLYPEEMTLQGLIKQIQFHPLK